MEGLQIWEEYKEMMETGCEFLRAELKNPCVAAYNNDIMLKIAVGFQDAIRLDILAVICLEAMKFVVPMAQDLEWAAPW
eukprot:5044376-Pyramimonas_sp.AAC.1